MSSQAAFQPNRRNETQERPLDNRDALVTGAGQGIDEAIETELARLGATYTLASRTIDAREEQRARLGPGHFAVGIEVTDDASVLAVIAKANERNGPVQILVNNSGAAERRSFQDAENDLWQRMLDVNLLGAVRCTRAVLSKMRIANEGPVVNVASTARLARYAYVSAYAADKHAVVGMTGSLALELARTGITVNAVCPGFTGPDLLADSITNIMEQTGHSEVDAGTSLARLNPQGRCIPPDEVTSAVGWLCLPGSASVTGQAISVAGGEVM